METSSDDVNGTSRIPQYVHMTRALVMGSGHTTPPVVTPCGILVQRLLQVTHAARLSNLPDSLLVGAMEANTTGATHALFRESVSCARLFTAVMTHDHTPSELPTDHAFNWSSTPQWAKCIQWWKRRGGLEAITPAPEDVPDTLRRFKKMARPMLELQWTFANAHAVNHLHGGTPADYTPLLRNVERVVYDRFRWVFSVISYLTEAIKHADMAHPPLYHALSEVADVSPTRSIPSAGTEIETGPCHADVEYNCVNDVSEDDVDYDCVNDASEDEEPDHTTGYGQHAHTCVVEVGPCDENTAGSTPKEVAVFVALASAVMKDEEKTEVQAFIASRSTNQDISFRSRFLACALSGIVDAHKHGRAHANTDILRDTLAVYWATPDTRTYEDVVSFGCPILASPCLPTRWETFAVRYQSEHAKRQWTLHTETLQSVVRITSGARQ